MVEKSKRNETCGGLEVIIQNLKRRENEIERGKVEALSSSSKRKKVEQEEGTDGPWSWQKKAKEGNVM